MKKPVFYRPNWRLMLADLVGFLLCLCIVGFLLPLHTQIPFEKYGSCFLCWYVVWSFLAYVFRRYAGGIRYKGYLRTSLSTFHLTLAMYALFAALAYWVFPQYSLSVLSVYVLIFFALFYLGNTCYFAYYYALDPEEEHQPQFREPQSVLQPSHPIDEGAWDANRKAILGLTGEKALAWIEEHADLRSNNTKVLATTNLFSFEQLRPYRYDSIVNIRSLNNIRGINRMFCMANKKLPDGGKLLIVFKEKSVKKQAILKKYPPVINWIIYSLYYFVKRVVPKLFLTRRLYYDITQGKRRVLSKTEVLGRLYYCGFEVVEEKKIEKYTYVLARRVKGIPTRMKRRYGPFIQLNRVGKNGKLFKVHKMRTMYPYSEFLQQYIFEHYSLQEGGKFNHDIRVNTLGRIMRRCWLDELPMLLNLLKGDMKLVGVRPLSNQYFSLYSPELQEKRIQFKPGLLPPFYADMPKTLDEIQASEMKYLTACEKNGTFRTDVRYIWLIIVNIVFKHARSH